MSKKSLIKHTLIVFSALLIMQPVFADEDDMSADNKPCEVIVKACLDGGYTRDGAEGKRFWKDCMKPTLLGKTVTGVTVDMKDVKACRVHKINKMKQEITELRGAK